MRSLQAVVSKELGAEQSKLQKQVTYSNHMLHQLPPEAVTKQVEQWKDHCVQLQQQLKELQAAHALEAQERLQEEETLSRDRAAAADVMCDAAFRQQQMTIRSQQQVKVLQKSSPS